MDKAPKQKTAKPGVPVWQQIITGLPTNLDAYDSFGSFGAAGGLTPIIGALSGGNPLAMFGARLLQSAFGQQEQRMPFQKPVDVNVLNFKDGIMDIFTLMQSRLSFSDTFGRRHQIQRAIVRPPLS